MEYRVEGRRNESGEKAGMEYDSEKNKIPEI
jgi:hypothetical protein